MSEKIWIRVYEPYNPRKGKDGFMEIVGGIQELCDQTKRHARIDVVSLAFGKVYRHDYKKAIPPWLLDDLLRTATAIRRWGVEFE